MLNHFNSDLLLSSAKNAGLKLFLEKMERRVLKNLILAEGTDLDRLANELRVSRATMYRRLKKYGLLTPAQIKQEGTKL